MFEQIIQRLPDDPNGVVITTLVAVGIGVGALTALLGGLHSRTTMALFMLVIGALVGLGLPRWFGWQVELAIPISICAVMFGIAGYALHRLWVAVLLGLLVAGVSLFLFYDQTRPLDKPAGPQVQLESSLPEMWQSVWNSAGPDFHHWGPLLALGVFVVAGLLGFMFKQFGMAALYALAGTLLTLGAINLGHASNKIHWLDSLKSGPMTTAALGMTMLLVGFLVQIALLYRPQKRRNDGAEEVE